VSIKRIAYSQFDYLDKAVVDGLPTIENMGYIEKPVAQAEGGKGTRVMGAVVANLALETAVVYRNVITNGVLGTIFTDAVDLDEAIPYLEANFPPNGWYFELSDFTAMGEWLTAMGLP